MEFRIKELKSKLNKTNKQIAADLYVSTYTVNSWLSGNRKPRDSQIILMERMYNLNPGWLIGETEKMYPDSIDDNKKRQIKDLMIGQSDFAIETIIRLSEDTESEWETIEHILGKR